MIDCTNLNWRQALAVRNLEENRTEQNELIIALIEELQNESIEATDFADHIAESLECSRSAHESNKDILVKFLESKDKNVERLKDMEFDK